MDGDLIPALATRPDFTARELDALRRKSGLKPSQWAERYRILPPSVSAEPGPWRNARTPYLVAMMDLCKETGVESGVFLKPTQIGGSEMLRNFLGACIDQDPGPTLIVMPDEQSAKEIMQERIRPLIEESPTLRSHMTGRSWDMKQTAVVLDSMPIFIGWAGSPQRLASRPIRYLLDDEVDKYPPFSGKEADPVSLARERTVTYGHRRFEWQISTPTTRNGNIWRAWEGCGDQRYYHVPCPHCREYQRLVWSRVKWPELAEQDRIKRADLIEQGDMAWYECEHCHKRIIDQNKPRMLAAGMWVSEGQTVAPDGTLTGNKPKAKRVGFHLNSLYSPWLKFSQLASEFLKSVGDPARMMNFRNSKLAEPFEEQASATKPDAIAGKRVIAGNPLVVPSWAGVVIATADVQKDHLYFVIRAWGGGARSQLLQYGIATDFNQLEQILFGRRLATASGGETFVAMVALDSRYRTDEVHKWAERDPARIWPTVGAAQYNAAPVREMGVKGYPGVIRRTINPNYWKDILHGYIHNEDETLWLPHNQIGDDYLSHMTSEHKIYDPRAGTWTWVPVSGGAQNHWFDCETTQCMASQLVGAHTLPSVDAVREKPNESSAHIDARSFIYGAKRW